MGYWSKHLSLSHPSFCVTLIGFTPAESDNMEGALRLAGGSTRFDIKRVKTASSASLPLRVIHAIVFTPTGLMQATAADEKAIRAATKPGTCRVYLSAAPGAVPSPGESRLDDFIQRTPTHGSAAIAKEVIAFFREADDLNRRSTPLAFRDMACLGAHRILKFLWPVSYLFAALHVLNTATVLSGHGPWLGMLAGQYVVPASTFFGAFFIVHGIFVVVRNWLFGARIVKKLNLGFALGAAGYGLATAATACSIAAVDQNVSQISFSAIFAVGAYLFYMYARRIRAECTSLSQLQATMADTRRRIETLNTIGRQPFAHSAFPLLPFRSRSMFISYMHGSQWSSETAALAHQWASDHGLEVFLDRSTIPSGTLWRQSLLRAISECGFFVGVIDGNATATEWVLAESAYAALLRKDIGKPRILLLVRNTQRIAQDQQNPFHLTYLDVFRLPPECCYGARILSADDNKLTAERFLRALAEVQPMCLLFGGRKPSQPAPQEPTRSSQPASVPSSDDLQVTDRSWRTSALLVMLFEAEGRSRGVLNLLLNKSYEWIRSSSSEKKTVGLNTLRLLFKSHHVPYSKDLLDKALDAFFSDASLAVKLAALDFLGSMSTTPSPLTRVSDAEARRIIEFRSKLMKQMNASQRAYAAKGVHADIARESSGRTHEEALRSVISRVDCS